MRAIGPSFTTISIRVTAGVRRRPSSWWATSPTDARLDELLAQRRFAAVVHCAAHIWVGESVREPARYYRQQHRQRDRPVRPVRQARRRQRRLLVDRRRLWRAGHRVDRREPAGGADQPLRRLQDDERAGAGRHGRGVRPALRHPALFQCRRRGRAARIGEATPDNAHLVKVACETALGLRPACHQRHRLPDPGWDLHPRLCPCRRPGARPSPGARASGRRRRAAGGQLRLWPRLQCPPGARYGSPGDRGRLPDRGGAAPRRRSGRAGRATAGTSRRCWGGSPATTISTISSAPPGAGSSGCGPSTAGWTGRPEPTRGGCDCGRPGSALNPLASFTRVSRPGGRPSCHDRCDKC